MSSPAVSNMVLASSVVAPPRLQTGPASLAEALFGNVGEFVTLKPTLGVRLECQHCEREAVSLLNDCLIVTHRHGTQYHKTVISLTELGYVRSP